MDTPIIRPIPAENPMREFGYRWEVIYPNNAGMGGTATKAEAKALARKWEQDHT